MSFFFSISIVNVEYILINTYSITFYQTSGRGQLWWPALGYLKIRKSMRQKQTENAHTYRERN